ncbi:MAG: EAL domain-containing protein [Clostridia bacterium]|nr:EAL domain-containing protein [Clostridia bacterium]
MLYSSAGLLALIIHLIINQDMLTNARGTKAIPARRSYRAFLIAVTVYYGTDILWGLFYGQHLVALTFADTALYFIAMAFSVILWTRYVIKYLKKDSLFGRILTWTGRIIFAFQVLMVCVNFFAPVLYAFDADGVYHAGKARYVTLVMQIAMYLMTAVHALSFAGDGRGTMKLRHRTVGLFSAAMAGFVTAQALFPLLPLYAIGCLLGSCLLHSFVMENEKEEYRDDLEERLKENLKKGNYYDLLTGLPSMTYFFELADAGKAEILRRGGRPVLMYMDFSGMKFYNTRYGFAEGDKLLQSFAMVLSQAFGSEHCCRIGGDHFAVRTEEEGLDEKLKQVFDDFQQTDNGKRIPVHVGVYRSQEENIHISIALDRAKIACDALKGRYGTAVNYYSQDLNNNAEKRQYIIENIDRAVREKWIQVYYQPIIRAVTEKVCDEEALARWIDPAEGMLSPADFIPTLEEAGLIYKLDLYVLEQVLQKIRDFKKEGLYIVPHSVNLSRSDFDACDIVEEIRRRVDDAGVRRDRITIEITESIVGGDFEFMKAQVERFQSLGFPVWMDDFGSGYSSLDVLQSIRFDLIKFDMSFMRKLDAGESGKIILTELMKMCNSLGVDTVCEGVETEAQVRFLQEIGCSKLQGFYFDRPRPLSHVLEWHRNHREDGYENPKESVYYEAIGCVNLYDLAVLANVDESAFQNTFNTLPMSIIEVRGDQARFVRSNQSYRDFINRFFSFDQSFQTGAFGKYGDVFMHNVVKVCCEQGARSFFEEKMPDGSVVHSFARRIAVNPVNGDMAVAVAVLSVSEPDEGASYAEIARALAADYYNIYIVDLDTDRYIEYSSRVGEEELAMERHGEDFFVSSRRDAHRIYAEDRETFYAAFSKEKVVSALDRQGVFTATYRLVDTGVPVYVNMKVTRMQTDRNHIIIGISIIDAQMKQEEAQNRIQRERDALARVMALSEGYLSLYSVDPDTGRYIEYSASDEYETLGFAKEGGDFFMQGIIDGKKTVHPEDLPGYLERFTRENILREIRERRVFRMTYRLVINGQPWPVSLRIARYRDGFEDKLVAGVRTRSAREE